MAKLDENGLKTQIRNKTYSNLYLFYGEESYLKQLYVNRIIDKTVNPSFSSFNLHNIEGKDATLDIIAECCEALPMMDDYTVVAVHDMPLHKLDAVESSKLQSLVSDMSPSTILIFWQDTVEVDGKDRKWAPVLSLFDKHGCCVNFSKKTTADLVKILVNGATKRECTLLPDDAKYLISVVGDDMNVLLNELDKVCFFADKTQITRKHIDAVAIKSAEATTFMLSKALLSGNLDKAYEHLDVLYFRKTEPTLIMGTLISAYVDMYRAKVSLTNGGTATALAEFFNYRNKEFRLTNAARDASKLSINQLRECLEILAQADEKLKLNFEESKTRLIIEQVMVKLVRV